jgi:hypothetical protein
MFGPLRTNPKCIILDGEDNICLGLNLHTKILLAFEPLLEFHRKPSDTKFVTKA